MNADSVFQIGATHAVCQDYAAAGMLTAASQSDGAAASCLTYAVLSDGCSSSPDTDVGARLLVKAAERLLRESGATTASGLAALHAEAARLALTWAGLLGLEPQAVDATLLTAHVSGDELLVGCSGDGVVCLQKDDGALDVYSVNYPSGFPVYPTYAHQPARLRGLAQSGRACKEVTRLRAPSVQERLRQVDVSRGDAVTEVFAFEAAAYRFAALFSDGVQSFLNAGRAEAVPLETVLPELVSFKNTRGAFVGRRMKMFLKDCQRKGWRHADDLSLAALHLGG
ncbi:MAG TPA: protein phosphatase 2C domain-containing protein [Pyrinomonadaceae bacterium]|nr:protein phosphatase 2C domain-containing protein [Pyrinomonadaceae bacterium]